MRAMIAPAAANFGKLRESENIWNLLWTPLKISSERFKLILVDRENPKSHSQFCQRGLQKCSLCIGTICATFSLLLEAVASPGLQDAWGPTPPRCCAASGNSSRSLRRDC